MATANDIRITSQAYDLLNCVAAGLDEVVLKIAEQIAQARNETPIRVTKDDIYKACEAMFDAIRQGVSENHLPTSALEAIDQMSGCLKRKYQGTTGRGEP